MSTKRVLGITIFGAILIIAAISVMLLSSFVGRDSDPVRLPVASAPTDGPNGEEPDALDRVEINRDTIQAVVSTLSRPESFSREVTIEIFWEGGQALNEISVSVRGDMTSIRILPAIGPERRIIVTPEKEYIWYEGDKNPFIRNVDSSGNGYRAADEYQMLLTFEDILMLNSTDISDAGYIEIDGEVSVYAVYYSRALGHLRVYYISLELGLIIAAVEHDKNGALIYRMTAHETIVGNVDLTAFILPDGTDLLISA